MFGSANWIAEARQSEDSESQCSQKISLFSPSSCNENKRPTEEDGDTSSVPNLPLRLPSPGRGDPVAHDKTQQFESSDMSDPVEQNQAQQMEGEDELSQYEKERMQNIQKNNEMMMEWGILESAEKLFQTPINTPHMVSKARRKRPSEKQCERYRSPPKLRARTTSGPAAKEAADAIREKKKLNEKDKTKNMDIELIPEAEESAMDEDGESDGGVLNEDEEKESSKTCSIIPRAESKRASPKATAKRSFKNRIMPWHVIRRSTNKYSATVTWPEFSYPALRRFSIKHRIEPNGKHRTFIGGDFLTPEDARSGIEKYLRALPCSSLTERILALRDRSEQANGYLNGGTRRPNGSKQRQPLIQPSSSTHSKLRRIYTRVKRRVLPARHAPIHKFKPARTEESARMPWSVRCFGEGKYAVEIRWPPITFSALDLHAIEHRVQPCGLRRTNLGRFTTVERARAQIEGYLRDLPRDLGCIMRRLKTRHDDRQRWNNASATRTERERMRESPRPGKENASTPRKPDALPWSVVRKGPKRFIAAIAFPKVTWRAVRKMGAGYRCPDITSRTPALNDAKRHIGVCETASEAWAKIDKFIRELPDQSVARVLRSARDVRERQNGWSRISVRDKDEDKEDDDEDQRHEDEDEDEDEDVHQEENAEGSEEEDGDEDEDDDDDEENEEIWDEEEPEEEDEEDENDEDEEEDEGVEDDDDVHEYHTKRKQRKIGAMARRGAVTPLSNHGGGKGKGGKGGGGGSGGVGSREPSKGGEKRRKGERNSAGLPWGVRRAKGSGGTRFTATLNLASKYAHTRMEVWSNGEMKIVGSEKLYLGTFGSIEEAARRIDEFVTGMEDKELQRVVQIARESKELIRTTKRTPAVPRGTRWTHEEDLLLMEGHARFPNMWKAIACGLPGRSSHAIRMRFFELVQNQNGGVDAGRASASRSNADAHDRPEKRKRDAASGETETKDLDVRPELLKGWLVEGNGYLRRSVRCTRGEAQLDGVVVAWQSLQTSSFVSPRTGVRAARWRIIATNARKGSQRLHFTSADNHVFDVEEHDLVDMLVAYPAPDKRTRITSAHGFFEVGQRVEAVYLTFGWHPATVVKIRENASAGPPVIIAWDDGEPSDSAKTFDQVRPLKQKSAVAVRSNPEGTELEVQDQGEEEGGEEEEEEEEEEGAGCAVCLSSSLGVGLGYLVQCEQCGIWVHKACYGLTQEEDPTEWYCSSCAAIGTDSDLDGLDHDVFRGGDDSEWASKRSKTHESVQHSPDQAKPKLKSLCVLCPVPGGALRPTTEGVWVHMLCARFAGMRFPEPRMEPVEGLLGFGHGTDKAYGQMCARKASLLRSAVVRTARMTGASRSSVLRKAATSGCTPPARCSSECRWTGRKGSGGGGVRRRTPRPSSADPQPSRRDRSADGCTVRRTDTSLRAASMASNGRIKRMRFSRKDCWRARCKASWLPRPAPSSGEFRGESRTCRAICKRSPKHLNKSG